MKTLLFAILLFSPGSVSFAQNPSTAPAAPGCSAADTKFDVKINDSQHPLAGPEPGKALVYFLQDDTYFIARPRPTTRFGLDGNWIGATHANSYFYVSVDPGEHHLCADWQSFVVIPTGLTTAAAHFTAEPGGIYFFVARNHSGSRYQSSAGLDFWPVDSDEAQILTSKFALATSRRRK